MITFRVFKLRRWIVLIAIVVTNVILMPFSMKAVIGPNLQTKKPTSPKEQRRNFIHVEKSYIILSFSKDDWISDLNRHVDMSHCEYTNCQLTEDQYLLPHSDAVIFHGVNLIAEPPLKPPGQIWIFLALESPIHHGKDFMFPAWNDRFNWTMMYRRDSDIYFPYSEVLYSENKIRKNYTDIIRKKTKLVAIASSHCNTPSKREDYIHQLKSYFPVDMYGSCGDFDCGPHDKQLECYKKLDTDYRFYLSFENSVCKDYITEKVFHTYSTDLIPVVRGGISYSKILPKETYIDTSDFQTIGHLADFILKLNSTEENLIKYLEQKHQFIVRDKQWTYQRAICNICEKLNRLESNLTHQFYHRIDDWLWGTDSCHYPKDILP